MAFAREAGYEVANLRPDYRKTEWDDFRPCDYHPGPRAQGVYAWKLFLALRAEVATGVDGPSAQLSREHSALNLE